MYHKNRDLFIGLTSIVILAVVGLLVINMANTSRDQVVILDPVPDFSFIEKNGESFGLDNMKTKISIVNFFFTSCQGPCPYMNSRVAELYKKYSTTDQVQFVSISVDPETDSLHVLEKYAKDFGVTDDRWLFLRGEIDEVQQLTEKGFKLAGELPNLHSTKLILVDSLGRIRGYYDVYNEESLNLLTEHVRTLLHQITI